MNQHINSLNTVFSLKRQNGRPVYKTYNKVYRIQIPVPEKMASQHNTITMKLTRQIAMYTTPGLLHRRSEAALLH
jgi:hypothetical protein